MQPYSPNLLIIAPNSPPTLNAEAIIFRRFLWELDKHCTGHVFRAKDAKVGWSKYDASMEIKLNQLTMHDLALPMHDFSLRLLRSRYANAVRCPDAEIWLQYMARTVLTRLPRKPDLLYSRFAPFGASMLAYKLKKKLQIPWIMHLSDPWPELPATHWRYHTALAQRDACFASADKIALTTQGQIDYYKALYPKLTDKFFVSPNVVPEENELSELRSRAVIPVDDKLHLVFAGSLYGGTSFAPLLKALALLEATKPKLLSHLRIDVYGNLTQPIQDELQGQSVIAYHGALNYTESTIKQLQADILLTIEIDEREPLRSKHLLITKVVGYMGLKRPMLSIACNGSVTENLCKEGYGWSVAHNDTEQLAELLTSLIEQRHDIRARREWKEPPKRLRAANVVQDLLMQMQQLKGIRS